MPARIEYEVCCVKDNTSLSKWSGRWTDLFTVDSGIDSACSYFRLGGDCQTLYQLSHENPIYILHQENTIKALIALKYEKSAIGGILKTPNFTSGEHYVTDMVLLPDVPNSALAKLFNQIFKDNPDILWVGFSRITEPQFHRFSGFVTESNWPALADFSTKHLSYQTKNTTIENYESALGKSTRHNMRKSWKRLKNEKGDISLAFISPSSADENTIYFNQFLELEASGWKGDEASAIKSKPLSLDFHRHMTETASTAGKLLWATLSVEGSPIAMLLILNRGDKLWVVKTAYNEDFKKYSPGGLLTYKLIQYAIDSSSINEIDMITEYDWHKRWNPIENQYYSLRLFRPTLKAKLVKALVLLKRSGWKSLLTMQQMQRNCGSKD